MLRKNATDESHGTIEEIWGAYSSGKIEQQSIELIGTRRKIYESDTGWWDGPIFCPKFLFVSVAMSQFRNKFIVIKFNYEREHNATTEPANAIAAVLIARYI